MGNYPIEKWEKYDILWLIFLNGEKTMIKFKAFTLEDRALYREDLARSDERGCEFSFANLFLWGRQRYAVVHDHVVLFSQFDRRTVYPWPVGDGEKKPVLDAIIEDAAARGIPCRLTGLKDADIALLQQLYPDRFRFHCDRGSYDYVYDIDDLADLKGRKYQKKRNHYNRFRAANPHCEVVPLNPGNVEAVKEMVDRWYREKLQLDPQSDFQMEQAAIYKALQCWQELQMEGLVLMEGDQVLAMTMGSFLSEDTVDVHFEKAVATVDGAYTAINCEFARYIRSKYPNVRFLNREEDMGLEGLRKAKESYLPHHMVQKCWAHLKEEGYDY